jgi:glutathione-independent formaldehyde dehydrogenase
MTNNKSVRLYCSWKVEILNTEYPDLVLMDGPGVNPLNVGRRWCHSESRI